MATIFLSYSRNDRNLMHLVRDQLHTAKLGVWTDEQIEPGSPSWQDEVAREIEVAQCVIVIFTPNSKASTWVKEELKYAKNQKRRIFPVLALGDQTSSVPFGYTDAEWVDIRENPGKELDGLIASLRKFIGSTSTDKKQRSKRRSETLFEFWTSLLERMQARDTKAFSRKSPGRQYWLGIGAGKKGYGFSYVLYPEWAIVELYIDVGDHDSNKAIFDRFQREKDSIEAEFGKPLLWDRLDNKRASRVRYRIENMGGSMTREKWPALQDAMIDAMIRLDGTFRSRIKEETRTG